MFVLVYFVGFVVILVCLVAFFPILKITSEHLQSW